MDYQREDIFKLLKDDECYIISSHGDYKVKIREFNNFDEMMQVNIGEQGGNFNIFVGILPNGFKLDWKGMQDLCNTYNEVN